MTTFPWRDRGVLVTGASGFIGKSLVRELLRNRAEVLALSSVPGRLAEQCTLDRQYGTPKCLNGNVKNLHDCMAIFHNYSVRTVFHLAADNNNLDTEISPVALFETNTRGVWNILEACRQSSTVEQVVILSSKEARKTEQAVCTAASPDTRPRLHPYSVSKFAAELIARAFASTWAVPVAVARLENVYGPGDDNRSRLIPSLISALLAEGKAELKGNGQETRDFIYVDDVVTACLHLAEYWPITPQDQEVFSISTGTQTPISQVASLLDQISREATKEVAENAPCKGSFGTGEPGGAEPGVGSPQTGKWLARTSLSRGLRRTFEWYRERSRETGAEGERHRQ